MKKLIVDLMNTVDGEDIANMELSEEETVNLTKDMNIAAVKSRAIGGIHTGRSALKNKGRVKGVRKAIAALVAAMAIGGTAFAAEYFDGFKFFYGEKANIATEDRGVINKTVTGSGIKMTINESIVSDKGAIIMLTFEKEDGTVLPKETVVQALDIKENKKISYMTNQKVSEDGKRLLANFEIDSSEKLEGKSLTVTADEVVNTQTGESIAKGPWQISLKISAKAKTVAKSLDLTLGNESERLILNKINVSALGVSFDGIKDDGNVATLPNYEPSVKVITVDGNSFELKCGSANEINNGFRLMYDLDLEYNKLFLDLSNIRTVVVDGNAISIN